MHDQITQNHHYRLHFFPFLLHTLNYSKTIKIISIYALHSLKMYESFLWLRLKLLSLEVTQGSLVEGNTDSC